MSAIRLIRKSVTPDRQPAFFIANSLGLDFLNSVATPVDAPVDWLDSSDGLVAWLAEAELVPASTLRALTAQAAPGELDKVAEQARALREWFRGFVREHMGRPLAAGAIEHLKPLNKLLARDEKFSHVAERRPSGGARLELETMRRWRSPEVSFAADRRSAGAMRVRRGLRQYQSVRGTSLHPDLRRPYKEARQTVVQHGDVRQSRQAGGSSPPTQGRALTQNAAETMLAPSFGPEPAVHVSAPSSHKLKSAL